MNRDARTILFAALGVLAPLAAIGCYSTVDGPTERRSSAGHAVESKALGLGSAGFTAPRLRWGRAAGSELPDDPTVVGVAHGSLLRSDGSTAAPTASSARKTQHDYITRLLGEASPAVRAEFETRSRPVEGDPREFVDNALLIAGLIEQVQPTDASDLASINRYIAKAMVEGELPAELGLVAGNLSSREAYIEECSEALVPIPPDWNPDEKDPENKWTKQPDPLTPTFISAEATTTTVWYYRVKPPTAAGQDPTPNAFGTCIALPRANSSGVITSLSVICQGNGSSKACFWDSTRNIPRDAKVAIVSDGFNAGPELEGGVGGRCTDCHRGENAFINHPGSSLDLRDDEMDLLFARDWVTPIVHSQWFQNPIPPRNQDEPNNPDADLVDFNPNRPSGESRCDQCHRHRPRAGGRLPFLQLEKRSKYCDFVIMKAILPGPTKTMPAFGEESPRYRSDQEAVAALCGWPLSAFEPWPAIDPLMP